MHQLRKLLFPFSLLYGGVTSLRNTLFDKGILKSKKYDIPVVSVGNLSTGGTGKSPMIEYLIKNLNSDFTIAVISRGYKRKTKGFKEVLVNSMVSETGDEPLQFKKKFPKVFVAVCEDRQKAIENLPKNVNLVLLDDAFQHRKVQPAFSILLTTFQNPYFDDLVLPAGNLRETKSGAQRANAIVVTKCPSALSNKELEDLREKLNPHFSQSIYFSSIGYGRFLHGNQDNKPLSSLKNNPFTLVTGIANPKPLVAYLKEEGLTFQHKSFSDHHNFTSSEVGELTKEKLILTTEKDFMRLNPLMPNSALYYLPISTQFLNNGGEELINQIISEIRVD